MDDDLDVLFGAYREAVPDLEPGAGFMPGLWARIEARRRFSLKLRFWAQLAASSAMALFIATTVFQFLPDADSPTSYTHTYVEVLDEESAPEPFVAASFNGR
jgi:hypothetical protein